MLSSRMTWSSIIIICLPTMAFQITAFKYTHETPGTVWSKRAKNYMYRAQVFIIKLCLLQCYCYFNLSKIFGGCSIQIYYYCIILYACQINTSLKILHDDTWGTSPERVWPREARELVKLVQRPHTGLIIFSTKQRYNKRSISTLGKHCLVSDWKKHIY